MTGLLRFYRWRPLQIPLAIVGVGAFLLLLALLLFSGGSEYGPQKAFEAHVQALLEGDFDTAAELLSEDCDVTLSEASQEFAESRDWTVTGEFIDRDQGEALLAFQNFPGFQTMRDEEGWVIACE